MCRQTYGEGKGFTGAIKYGFIEVAFEVESWKINKIPIIGTEARVF